MQAIIGQLPPADIDALTSNLPFSGWGGVFGDQAVAAAMIDRPVHHADVLTLKGASYRLRNRGLDCPASAPAPANPTPQLTQQLHRALFERQKPAVFDRHRHCSARRGEVIEGAPSSDASDTPGCLIIPATEALSSTA
jgi:hypothetical protein